MTIIFLKNAAGIGLAYSVGAEADFSDTQAKELLDTGFARYKEDSDHKNDALAKLDAKHASEKLELLNSFETKKEEESPFIENADALQPKKEKAVKK